MTGSGDDTAEKFYLKERPTLISFNLSSCRTSPSFEYLNWSRSQSKGCHLRGKCDHVKREEMQPSGAWRLSELVAVGAAFSCGLHCTCTCQCGDRISDGEGCFLCPHILPPPGPCFVFVNSQLLGFQGWEGSFVILQDLKGK